ncbi:MAG: 30S ribosomal protein S7 [Candidatus Schekmanbacteria bacterium RBG_13_48_7]|uniref:Small ribosomal subunit protein uS7 n=1 Tax=Candidatus Schekmanbacteria bacterium RBG_13_48_7 TaxID=1817878 RepID=A0A1F7RNP9_9BACT|nr:MAG: 30S ribosomal protein S7 [Candidatus Schekmanbacteria bacterium RBG_13_48_7]
MPRRKVITKREVRPDPIYNSILVTKVINNIMKKGKRSVAEQIFYNALDIIEKKAKNPPLEIFNKAIENVKPQLEVKSRRVGGSTYQVPVEVRPERRSALSIKWILTYARNRAEKGMPEKLAAELLDAANNRGAAIKKKEDTLKMAEANKAFAHYRW